MRIDRSCLRWRLKTFPPSATRKPLIGMNPELDRVFTATLRDTLKRWQKSDGSFRARKLLVGWDNVPMHRWAQSQMFRSLCFLLAKDKASNEPERVQQSKVAENTAVAK